MQIKRFHYYIIVENERKREGKKKKHLKEFHSGSSISPSSFLLPLVIGEHVCWPSTITSKSIKVRSSEKKILFIRKFKIKRTGCYQYEPHIHNVIKIDLVINSVKVPDTHTTQITSVVIYQ